MNLDHVFARKTRQHSIALQNSPPCAKELYDWLLRAGPAGKPTEIYLEKFQAEQSGRLHGKGYQMRWIKDCLKELIELELVKVVYKFSSKVFKLITFHPEQRNAESMQTSAQNLQENAELQPSNADSLALLYREIKETTDRPTTHPVVKNEQEGSIGSTLRKIKIESQEVPEVKAEPIAEPQPQMDPKLEPQVVEEIKAAGFRLNTALLGIVRSTTAQIVLDALEATQQYQRNLQQKNQPLRREPEAVLMAAIHNQWSPSGSNRQGEVAALPDGFNEWFKLAREVGLVEGSSAQADLTGQLPGVLCVLTVSGKWELFEQMRRLHVLSELRETAKMQRGAIEFTPSPRLVALRMQKEEEDDRS